MGIETTTSFTITCDNAACPGNSLDPASHEGWIQIQASVLPGGEGVTYAMPIMSPLLYFCSPACAGTVEQTLVAAEEAREAAANPPMPDKLPDEEPEATSTQRRGRK